MGQRDCNLRYFINHCKIENACDKGGFKLTSCLFKDIKKVELMTYSTDTSPFLSQNVTTWHSPGGGTGEGGRWGCAEANHSSLRSVLCKGGGLQTVQCDLQHLQLLERQDP